MRPSLEAVERRRRLLRTVLFLIIIGTLPFYCLGFYLWGTSPDSRSQPTDRPTATWTPIGQNVTTTRTFQPTITPLFSVTPLSPLLPTPGQFVPIPVVPTQQFIFPTATFVVIPSATTAPTLTVPPSATPLPSATPQPSATPPPTNTLPPTETPTVLLPPTDTPPAETTPSVGP